jgi:hypothetical protein
MSEQPDAAAPTTPSQIDGSPDKLHGGKLFILLGSITLVTFLALLDTSIVGTVRTLPSPIPLHLLTRPRLFQQ